MPNVQQFQPLTQINTIMQDRALTATQRLVLIAAVTRTSNGSRRVRCSQQVLADLADVSRETVNRVLRRPAVRRYFVIERDGRKVNLTWRRVIDDHTTCDPPSHHLRTSASTGQPLEGRFSLDSVEEEGAVDHWSCHVSGEEFARIMAAEPGSVTEPFQTGDGTWHFPGLRSDDPPSSRRSS